MNTIFFNKKSAHIKNFHYVYGNNRLGKNN